MRRSREPAPTLVLFDMDDTLFDHSLTCRAALEALRRLEPRLAAQPLGAQWEEYLRLLNSVAPETGADPVLYRRARARRFEALASSCGWSTTTREADELSARYREFYQAQRRPVPGGARLLRNVGQNARVGIVTNNTLEEQEEKLRFLGIANDIDFMVVSADVGVAKPDPKIFAIALREGSARPGEAVMVGDSWTNDVLGARSARIRPVWFNRFGASRPTRHRVGELRTFRPARAAQQTILGIPPPVTERRRLSARAL